MSIFSNEFERGLDSVLENLGDILFPETWTQALPHLGVYLGAAQAMLGMHVLEDRYVLPSHPWLSGRNAPRVFHSPKESARGDLVIRSDEKVNKRLINMPPKGIRKSKNSASHSSRGMGAGSGKNALQPSKTRGVPILSQSASGQNWGAPTAIGFRSGSSSFSVGSNYQKITDISGSGRTSTLGLRVAGTDALQSLTVGFPASSTSSFCLSSGGIYVSQFTFSPGVVSDRLIQFEELYQYYAFRHITLRYIPGIGPDTVNSNSTPYGGQTPFAIGICQNNENKGWITFISAGMAAFTAVREFNPSFTTNAWLPAKLEYDFTGMRVWECDSTDEKEAEQLFQMAITGSLIGVGDGKNHNDTVGYFEIDYVVDFYNPTPIGNSPALRSLRSVSRRLSIDERLLLLDYAKQLLEASKQEKKVEAKSGKYQSSIEDSSEGDGELVPSDVPKKTSLASPASSYFGPSKEGTKVARK